VISDIDDTIKITEIPAGFKVVVINTFFRDFVAAPEMAKMYQGFNGASFHYVSGGPWQLYGPLSEFLFSEKAGFPEGTFHMKQVSKNLLSAATWEDLKGKRCMISPICETFCSKVRCAAPKFVSEKIGMAKLLSSSGPVLPYYLEKQLGDYRRRRRQGASGRCGRRFFLVSRLSEFHP
jgi:Uncharacterized conserved protein (DUF2183)